LELKLVELVQAEFAQHSELMVRFIIEAAIIKAVIIDYPASEV